MNACSTGNFSEHVTCSEDMTSQCYQVLGWVELSGRACHCSSKGHRLLTPLVHHFSHTCLLNELHIGTWVPRDIVLSSQVRLLQQASRKQAPQQQNLRRVRRTSSRRSAYAFAHQQGYGELITSGKNMRVTPAPSSPSAGGVQDSPRGLSTGLRKNDITSVSDEGTGGSESRCLSADHGLHKQHTEEGLSGWLSPHTNITSTFWRNQRRDAWCMSLDFPHSITLNDKHGPHVIDVFRSNLWSPSGFGSTTMWWRLKWTAYSMWWIMYWTVCLSKM